MRYYGKGSNAKRGIIRPERKLHKRISRHKTLDETQGKYTRAPSHSQHSWSATITNEKNPIPIVDGRRRRIAPSTKTDIGNNRTATKRIEDMRLNSLKINITGKHCAETSRRPSQKTSRTYLRWPRIMNSPKYTERTSSDTHGRMITDNYTNVWKRRRTIDSGLFMILTQDISCVSYTNLWKTWGDIRPPKPFDDRGMLKRTRWRSWGVIYIIWDHQ